MIRIAITGPESSGKTTLSIDLGKYFGVQPVSEFARTYLVSNNGNYVELDLLQIAKNQQEWWEKFEGTYLIADTEMSVLKIWSEEKFGRCHPFILEAYRKQQFDHYFLCSPDIPWENDCLRENPHDRDRLFEVYKVLLEKSELPFTILYGTKNQRLNKAIEVIGEINR